MTPDDVLAQLPNGMHDASIREMRVQFGRQLVTLDMDFRVGDMDAHGESRTPTGAMQSRRWSDCRRVSCGDGAVR